jgi:hypothetical protein
MYYAQASVKLGNLGVWSHEDVLSMLSYVAWRGNARELWLVAQDVHNALPSESRDALEFDMCVRSGGSDVSCSLYEIVISREDHYTYRCDSPVFKSRFDIIGDEWRWSPMIGRSKWGDAFYLGGRDCQVPSKTGCAVRIQGFWKEEQNPSAHTGFARAGFETRVELEKDQCYEISFSYRTSALFSDNKPGVWLGTIGREERLSDTDGEWIRYSMVVKNNVEGEQSLLFRMWGVGVVWYDNVCIEPIVCE